MKMDALRLGKTLTTRQVIEAIQTLTLTLISRATGEAASEHDYAELRAFALKDPRTAPHVPAFLRTCRDLGAFWSFIKGEVQGYEPRRRYLREKFEPVLARLEAIESGMANVPAEKVALRLESELVRDQWSKANQRCGTDPEGAITLARTLLETVCKLVLHEHGVTADDKWDLPKLYREVATQLKLAPDQHAEEAFRSILGGCMTVVNGLATLRNRLGDAHGKGPGAVRPSTRHAELAVCLAGSMAVFLTATWEARSPKEALSPVSGG